MLPDLVVAAATRPKRLTKANSFPGPLALLPVARSPSRPCLHDRWWALTPPVRPLPALLRSAGGNAFCCGCSQDAALAGLPPLTVSWGDPVLLLTRLADIQDAGLGVGKFLWAIIHSVADRGPATAHPLVQPELYHEKERVSSIGVGCATPVATAYALASTELSFPLL